VEIKKNKKPVKYNNRNNNNNNNYKNIKIDQDNTYQSKFSSFNKQFLNGGNQRNRGFLEKNDPKLLDQLEIGDNTNNINDTEKIIYEMSDIYDDNLGDNLFLHCSWTVWTHREDCPDWTEKNYTNVYTINSVGTFWRFFNNFHLYDKSVNQFFIMRNKIKPIWEDNENIKGGKCSFKFDNSTKNNKMDIGVDLMICMCLLIMNETFLLNGNEINGISYAVIHKNVMIKIWSKNYSVNIPDKIPSTLIIKFNNILKNYNPFIKFIDKYNQVKRIENKISIKYKPIDE
jgi:hypothetical protein